jgi:chromosome segregation ATPase
VAAKRE